MDGVHRDHLRQLLGAGEWFEFPALMILEDSSLPLAERDIGQAW